MTDACTHTSSLSKTIRFEVQRGEESLIQYSRIGISGVPHGVVVSGCGTADREGVGSNPCNIPGSGTLPAI